MTRGREHLIDSTDGPDEEGPRQVEEGLQHERTALAWDRTALAMLVVGALLVRTHGPTAPGAGIDAVALLGGGLALVVGALQLVLAGQHHVRRARRSEVGSLVRPWLDRVTGIAVVVVGVAALVAVISG